MRAVSCASRSRIKGEWYYQSHFENKELGEVANAITRVPKDSMVMQIYETD